MSRRPLGTTQPALGCLLAGALAILGGLVAGAGAGLLIHLIGGLL